MHWDVVVSFSLNLFESMLMCLLFNLAKAKVDRFRKSITTQKEMAELNRALSTITIICGYNCAYLLLAWKVSIRNTTVMNVKAFLEESSRKIGI